MTQSTASFIDQLEAAALGKNIPIPNPVAKHAPKFNKPATHKDKKKASKKGEVKHKKDIYEEVEPTVYTGSIDGALNDLSTLFENAFNVTLREEEEDHIVGQIEESPIIPSVVEELNVEEVIEPTINPEAIENATSELLNLFEIMAGVDLVTGEKIEEPITEEVIDIPVPLPTTYSTILNGSRNLNDVVALPKIEPTLLEKQNAASDILMRDWKGDLEGSKNAKASQVIADVTGLLERHRNEMPEKEYKILESDAVDKTVKYINDLQLDEAETYTNNQSMPFTGANMPLVSGPQFTFAVGNILRKMMATGPGSGDVELVNLDDVDASNISATHQFLAWDAAVEKFVAAEGTTPIGDISGVTAGAGLTGGGTQGTVELDVVGTANRISVSANAVDIASTYVGQNTITTLGTIGTGTWQGTAIADAYIGTGINATKLANGSVTNTELQYINSLSSNAQTQITDVKTTADAAASTGFTIAMSAALG